MSSTQHSSPTSPTSRYSWATLWLALAALALLGTAVLAALPIVFESSAADRAQAQAARGWPALALAILAGLAAVASGVCSRRATR